MSDPHVIEQPAASAPRRVASVVSTAALVFARVAVAALVMEIGLGRLWSDLTCGEGRTIVLDRLMWAAIILSGFALLPGIAALFSRCENKGRAVVGIAIAVGVAALLLPPDGLGGYVCGITVA